MMPVAMKGSRPAPRSMRSAMETLLFTANEIAGWKVPPFQRPLRVNEKVREVSEGIKTMGGIIPGVLTLGRLGQDKSHYIVDGQHRIEAFKLSGLKECIADVRICTFEDIAHMAEEFVELNSRLVNMRPDDVLRGLEGTVTSLLRIREECPFVGYDQIRRGDSNSAVVSMSSLLRCWFGSQGETPAAMTGKGAARLATELSDADVKSLVKVLSIARAAWRDDPEYYRLWGTLNLTMTMWLWRRLVIDTDRGVRRYVVLTPDQFKKCLMAQSAAPDYIDWLRSRTMSERDRSPCYARIKSIFAKRLTEEGGTKKILMPMPTWSAHSGG